MWGAEIGVILLQLPQKLTTTAADAAAAAATISVPFTFLPI